MFEGDGAETLELQAYKWVKNAGLGRMTYPCSQCGIIMNPVEYLYSVQGLCAPCAEARRAKRIKGKMA